MEIPFDTYYENESILIQEILEYPVFGWINEDDEDEFQLKAYEGFPPNDLINFKLLCLSLSNNSVIEYNNLLNNVEINQVYELLAMNNANNYILKQKYDKK